MLISIRHVTRYSYAEPVSYTIQSLRLTPAAFEGQRVLDWRVGAAGAGALLQFKDGFGNAVDLITINARHEAGHRGRWHRRTEDRNGGWPGC